MSDLTIKVNLAGRTYPVTTSESEKEIILKAVELVNETVESLKKNYAVKDSQDLLAMAALQVASRLSLISSESDSRSSQLHVVEQMLNDALSQF